MFCGTVCSAAVEGEPQKAHESKKGEEKNMMKEVCSGGEEGTGVSASELEPMKSEMGQAGARDAVTATHGSRLGLMSSTSQSWHKLCLPECLPHTHTHARTNGTL